jgi:hypothetical protein
MGSFDHQVFIEEEVQIDDPRAPWDGSLTAHEPFHRFENVKKLSRFEFCGETGSGIEKKGLLGHPHRSGLIQRGNLHHSDAAMFVQLSQGSMDLALAIAQV